MMAIITLSIGSALFHGLSTKWAGHLDVIGIYWVFGALLFFSLGVLCRLPEDVIAMAMLVLAMLLAPFIRLVLKFVDLKAKVALLLALTYIFEILICAKNEVFLGLVFIFGSLLVFGIAYWMWRRDIKKQVLCTDTPRSVGFGKMYHAAWHVLSAIAISMVFYVPSTAVVAGGST